MRFRSLTPAFWLAAAAALFIALPGAEAHQRVYADPYGNLIVISPSGYKQIIVGKGHLADEVRAAIGEPKIVYRSEGHRDGGDRQGFGQPPYGDDALHAANGAECIHNGVVLHGRAFMYGINRGEAADLSPYCR
jgi:hypothetical protein